MRLSLHSAALVLLLAVTPAAAQMTPAEESAYQALWQLTEQGQGLLASGNLTGAEAAFAAVLALVERELPAEPLTRATALHNLAAVRADLGQLLPAEAMAREALALRAGAPAEFSTQALLAAILRDLERFAEARDLMAASVQTRMQDESADRSHLVPDVAALAALTAEAGNLEGGLDLIGQLEPMLPDFTPAEAVATFTVLGRLASMSGQPLRAEGAYREALARSAKLEPGLQWRVQDQAVLLGNLGSMLLAQGRRDEAAALFTQADGLLTGAGITGGLIRANLLDGLGLARQDQPQAGFAAQRLALDLRLAALPEDHPAVGASFAALGETLLRAGDTGPAAQSLARAVAIQTAGGDRLRAARANLSLAAAEAAQGQAATALPRALTAEASLTALLPPGHPEAARAGFNAAWLALAAGQPATALPLARTALDHFIGATQGIGLDATLAGAADPDMRRQVIAVTAAAWELDRAGLIDEAFQAAQWAIATRAGRATQRMSARFAAGTDDLAQLVRAKQDKVNLWAEADRLFLAALSRPEEGLAIDSARADAESLAQDIAALERDLAMRFPDYTRLVTPGVLSLDSVQASLHPGEALVLILPTPDETYVFAISATAADWTRAALTQAELDSAVRTLRAQLDPNAPARSAEPLEPAAPQGPGFDRALAHDLYTRLLAPLDGVLRGKERLLVVADGPLSSLPLSVLVTEAPQGDDRDPAALAATPWLIRRHALATLPAVTSLNALRQPRPARPEGTPFAGFGAPDFAGDAATPAPLARFFTGEAAQTAALRGLAPLPATAPELKALAKALAAPAKSLRLGKDASEAAVKSAPDLAGAAVVAFATHGLLAGDIAGLAEPALAFTPPDKPSAQDDGLLTASEAALLTLSADWVILSACNTAADDGTPGAEGLSGLASGFLYAGARSLLVSHWPVRDDAAAALTQSAVQRLAADPAMGRAEAVQAAMLALAASPGFAHPSAWAPFVLVGDGG